MKSELVTTAYLTNAESCRQLSEALAIGEKAIAEGRIFTNKEAKKKMSKWLNKED